MFQHILFPIDFSDRCKQVAPSVKALASRHQARVTLMHVVQIPAGWYGGMDGGYPIMFDVEEMKNDARRELTSFYAAVEGPGPDRDIQTFVSHGDAGYAIVQQASESNVDLIMMPTHGYGRFRRLLLGSVTSQVLHDAQCAVWTAAHTEETSLLNHINCRNILCAVDDTEKSLPLIRRAAELARELTASLTLVHAVPLLLDPEIAQKGIAALQAAAGTKLRVSVAPGNVSDVVREAAVHHATDLIVIGRGRSKERFGGLRTNAYAIIRDSPCPVLTV